ncbi:hypothetical protein F4820DRAFT_130291 [Hypoxylon rubiginosum]|uniref:Uncharacterized protein n=1 Tax=Hypoxylon rubiginosum TaxID=110542 RepID=A0ACB9YL77_9PEZI|nr:hypothetical protein F4820DRAFT_130291 [Hypoxylon rubiginosum]
MPFRDLISRLDSKIGRKRQDRGEELHEGEDADNLEAPSTQGEHLRTAQDSSQPSSVDVSISKPVKGLRKATVSNRRQLTQAYQRRSTSNTEPSDYLYFGEGIKPADVSQSLLNRDRRKSANDAPEQLPTRTHSSSPSSGQDGSGFLRTELNTHTTQMGYSCLTYGGSLQYDYAETQG